MSPRVSQQSPSRPELSNWRRSWRGPIRVLLVMVLGGMCLQRYYNNNSKYVNNTPASLYDMETKSGGPKPGVSPKSRGVTAPSRDPIEPPLETNEGAQPWWREVMCKMAGQRKDKPGTPLRRLFRDVTPKKDNDVFLMDTACNSRPKYRVWCSVESWARQNPTRQVWFLLVSGELAEAKLPRVLLQNYANLHVVDADLDDLFRDTPLLTFFSSRKWAQMDTWPVERLSDMLRVLLLWRWGGVYSDTDVISIRPLTLPLNALGFAAHDRLGNAFCSFRARHPILLELMNDMPKNFKPKQYGSIGPLAYTRVVESACGKNQSLVAEKAPYECPENLTLYPEHTFYPILHKTYKKFFARGGGKDFSKMFNETFILHFWNKLSKGTMVKVNSNSIYEVAAKNFCPLTFQMATADSDSF